MVKPAARNPEAISLCVKLVSLIHSFIGYPAVNFLKVIKRLPQCLFE